MKNAPKATLILRWLIVPLFIFSAFPTVGFAADEKTVYTFQADGLACPFCAYGIEKQVQKLKGVVSVSTDVASGNVTVTMQQGAALEQSAIDGAVKKAGFTMRKFKQQ